MFALSSLDARVTALDARVADCEVIGESLTAKANVLIADNVWMKRALGAILEGMQLDVPL